MILPSKHLSERRALLTVGGEILGLLDRPRTVSSLWEAMWAGKDRTRRLSSDWFVLALDSVFFMNAVVLRDSLIIKLHISV